MASPSASPSPGPPDAPKLSPGEVAGIAIICTIVGTFLGSLATFLTYRRINRVRAGGGRGYDNDSRGRKDTPPGVLSSGRTSAEGTRHLPETGSDSELAAQVARVGARIQEHVETHYHLEQVQPKLGSLVKGLNNLGVSRRSDMTSGELINLVLDPYTRHAALQHIISLVVFKSIDFSARSRLSILPGPVAAFLKALPSDETDEGIAEVNAALARWRILSAYLLRPSKDKKAALVPVEASITSQAMAIVSVMNTFLYPFLEVEHDTDRKQRQAQDLQAIVLESATLGYALFSHPCEWRFRHSTDGLQPMPGLILVCPGLERTGSRDGKVLTKPVTVVEPTVRRL